VATYNSSRLQTHGFGLGIVMGHDLKSVRCVLALESAFFRPRAPPTEVPPTACFDVCRRRHLGSMHGMFVATRQCAATAQYTNAFSSGFVATITAYMAQIPGVSDRMTRQNDMSSAWGLCSVEHSTYKLLLQGIRKIDLSSIMQELRRNIEANGLILRACVSQNTRRAFSGEEKSVFLGDETLRQFLLRGSTDCDAQAQVPPVYRVRPHARAPEYPLKESVCKSIRK
jgi:hypothetical protein